MALCNRHVLSLLGRGVAAGSRLATFMLLARLLGAEGLGAWILYLTTTGFLHMCRRGMVKSGLVRYAAGVTGAEQRTIVGTGWGMAILLTGLASAGVAVWDTVFPVPEGFGLFVTWYPLVTWALLPVDVSSWLAEADDRFDRVLWMEVMKSTALPVVLAVVLLGPSVIEMPSLSITPDLVAGLHVGCNGLASLIALMAAWGHVTALPHGTLRTLRRLFNFGRYSLGTLIGTHLLTSSDTYLLGVLAGPSAVALYGVAQKVVRVVLVPLRALSATAYPTLSRLSERGARTALIRYAHRWILLVTLAAVPVLCVLAGWPSTWVRLLGGTGYGGAAPVLQWFVVYLALAPLDRMLGLLFDSIEQPQMNLIKVSIMLVVNVAGDVLAYWATGSVAAVAAVTTLTLATGIGTGLALLPADMRIGGRDMYRVAMRLWVRVRMRLRAA